MRTLLVVVCVFAVLVCPNVPGRAREGAAKAFNVDLVDFPDTIRSGETLQGKIRIKNRRDKRHDFTVQTYVKSDFGAATLLTRLITSIPGGESFDVAWTVPTESLPPGEYDVRIGVKRSGEPVLVPLHFTVE